MEKNEITNIVIDGNQAVLCAEIFQEPQRLTPTGKISHAKTRVYIQRYRKEWEQMPDFKGWLTSVPSQATRAFCIYCKKNLHAHRLSLLKHTGTMKHQRSALMYKAEMNKRKMNETHSNDNDENEKIIGFNSQFDHINIESTKTDNTDKDEKEEDFDFVVERLETEDEENSDHLRDDQSQGEHEPGNEVNGDEDEEEEEEEVTIPPARISTHVLDTTKGVPVGGLQVSLYKLMDGRWTFLNESTTSPSGRCTDLVDMKKSQITAGRYKIHFDVDKYFTLRRIETMYPFIEIVFDVKNPTGNYHIPILLSPLSYTTYRGTDR